MLPKTGQLVRRLESGRLTSKRYDPLQQPINESGFVGIGDDALTIENDFHVCNGGRKNHIIWGDVAGAHDAANPQDLAFSVDGCLLHAFDAEITVRKHLRDARRYERLQLSGT